mgnify:CR=1 FL=1
MSITLDGTSGITSAGTIADATAVVRPLVSGTSVASTSGTSIDFTSIPSWVKRITVMFAGVSVSGTAFPMVQLGTSGGIEATGYLGAAETSLFTTGFYITGSNVAANIFYGQMIISLIGSNAWVESGVIGYSNAGATAKSGGYKPLSGTLDRVRITTSNGTDTFDAGSINILYE